MSTSGDRPCSASLRAASSRARSASRSAQAIMLELGQRGHLVRVGPADDAAADDTDAARPNDGTRLVDPTGHARPRDRPCPTSHR